MEKKHAKGSFMMPSDMEACPAVASSTT